ncbi:MAG TPA: hypothetical protein VIU37_00200 [Candidatus Limnocylindrales bacterium]
MTGDIVLYVTLFLSGVAVGFWLGSIPLERAVDFHNARRRHVGRSFRHRRRDGR